jgi:hypothetical protein
MVWYLMVCIGTVNGMNGLAISLYGMHWKWYGMVWYVLEFEIPIEMEWYAMVWYAMVCISFGNGNAYHTIAYHYYFQCIPYHFHCHCQCQCILMHTIVMQYIPYQCNAYHTNAYNFHFQYIPFPMHTIPFPITMHTIPYHTIPLPIHTIQWKGNRYHCMYCMVCIANGMVWYGMVWYALAMTMTMVCISFTFPCMVCIDNGMVFFVMVCISIGNDNAYHTIPYHTIEISIANAYDFHCQCIPFLLSTHTISFPFPLPMSNSNSYHSIPYHSIPFPMHTIQ